MQTEQPAFQRLHPSPLKTEQKSKPGQFGNAMLPILAICAILTLTAPAAVAEPTAEDLSHELMMARANCQVARLFEGIKHPDCDRISELQQQLSEASKDDLFAEVTRWCEKLAASPGPNRVLDIQIYQGCFD